jgi:hypothetical protein
VLAARALSRSLIPLTPRRSLCVPQVAGHQRAVHRARGAHSHLGGPQATTRRRRCQGARRQARELSCGSHVFVVARVGSSTTMTTSSVPTSDSATTRSPSSTLSTLAAWRASQRGQRAPGFSRSPCTLSHRWHRPTRSTYLLAQHAAFLCYAGDSIRNGIVAVRKASRRGQP